MTEQPADQRKEADSSAASAPKIADGPAADADPATVVPADQPKEFPFMDGARSGRYVKRGNSYHYEEL